MKFKKTDHWTSKDKQEGLLFFSQIIDESLFDYSLDSYKPQALNTRLLCIEALQTISHIDKGLIKKPNLRSIIEELKWSLQSDLAAKSILGFKYEHYYSLLNINSKTNELKNVIELLYEHLNERNYLKTVKQLLTDKIPEARAKEDIYSLTRVLLTELINYGYSPGYIYHFNNKYFYDSKSKVSDTEPTNFLNNFSFKRKKFKVIYKGDKLFTEFSEFAKDFKIQFVNSKDEIKKITSNSFVKSKRKNEVFIICNEVESFDEVSARLDSELPITKIANLFSFYHHKSRPLISDKALIINENDKSEVVLEKPLKSIIKKQDIKPLTAVAKVKKLFDSLDLPQETIFRISRAIDLHSVALETNEIDNKLLSLWTAIETLIQKDLSGGKDRIIQIIEGITPFENNTYFNRIISQMKSDFWHYDKKLSKDIFSRIKIDKKESLLNNIAALICTKENEKTREYTYSKIKDFPLLRWRMFKLSQTFGNGKNALSLLQTHNQKVEWQIRRIYRVRNLIVHSGFRPSYTNILVENFHNYFDSLMDSFIDSAIKENKIKRINHGILEFSMRTKSHFDLLEKFKDSQTDLSNYKQIVFGLNNE